jgi:hypothetical protein
MITGQGISHKNYQLVMQIQSKIFYRGEGVGGGANTWYYLTQYIHNTQSRYHYL